MILCARQTAILSLSLLIRKFLRQEHPALLPTISASKLVNARPALILFVVQVHTIGIKDQGRLPLHALDYYSIPNLLLVMVQFPGSGN